MNLPFYFPSFLPPFGPFFLCPPPPPLSLQIWTSAFKANSRFDFIGFHYCIPDPYKIYRELPKWNYHWNKISSFHLTTHSKYHFPHSRNLWELYLHMHSPLTSLLLTLALNSSEWCQRDLCQSVLKPALYSHLPS